MADCQSEVSARVGGVRDGGVIHRVDAVGRYVGEDDLEVLRGLLRGLQVAAQAERGDAKPPPATNATPYNSIPAAMWAAMKIGGPDRGLASGCEALFITRSRVTRWLDHSSHSAMPSVTPMITCVMTRMTRSMVLNGVLPKPGLARRCTMAWRGLRGSAPDGDQGIWRIAAELAAAHSPTRKACAAPPGRR